MNDYYMMMCDLENEEKSDIHWLDKYIEQQEEQRVIIESFEYSETPEIDLYWAERERLSAQKEEF